MAYIGGNEILFSSNVTVVEKGSNIPVEQTTGDSTTAVMSQKATTEALAAKAEKTETAALNEDCAELEKRIDTLEGLLIKYEEKNSNAYKIEVPEGAAHKAILHRVGGMLYRSTNLSEIGVINISQSIDEGTGGTEYLGTFGKGVYHFSVEESEKQGSLSGFNISGDEFSEIAREFTVTLTKTQEVYLYWDVNGITDVDLKIMINYGTFLMPFENPINCATPTMPEVTAVNSYSKSGELIDTINLADMAKVFVYGEAVNENAYNYIDFDTKKYMRAVDTKTISADEVTEVSGNNTRYNLALFSFPKPKNDIAYGHCKNGGGSYLEYFNQIWEGKPFDDAKYIGNLFCNASNNTYVVGFPVGTTIGEAQDMLHGLKLYYTLAEPVAYTSLPQNLADYEDYKYIKVEAGGKIELANTNKLGVPCKVTFVIT